MAATFSRPKWIVLIEISSVLVFFVVLALHAMTVLQAIDSTERAILFVGCFFFGYLVADFGTGCVHFFCDRFFEEDTFILGPGLIKPFREHHRDPEGMTKHDFFELNGHNCLAMIPLICWARAYPMALTTTWGFFANAFLLSLSFGVFGTNQFHAWAHVPHPNRVIAWLQRRDLILSPVRHGKHHSGDHSKSYCVTTGWMNPFCDRFGVFRLMEKTLMAMGVPRSKTIEDEPSVMAMARRQG